VNHKIRAPQVRVIGPHGEMIGVITVSEAMQIAVRNNLDLVELSPNAEPPVCRIMDYGKFKYEVNRKEREARKHQHAAEMKEIKFHANVGDHDFETKVGHIRGFLEKGMKVKSSLYFRGRENAHREIGFDVMQRVVKACEDLSVLDMTPKLIGNSIVMVMSARPNRPAVAGGRPVAPAAPVGTAPAPRPAPAGGSVLPAAGAPVAAKPTPAPVAPVDKPTTNG
jgi:translation initiation factor IF-3